jgi:bifunctional UDP-N-acetylglucosamine pyrophosphorylase / glucosamine-1-phosphate N-acetyltransferase
MVDDGRRTAATNLPATELDYEPRTAPMTRTTAVILAAGKGTRMKSDLPKVLIEVCGRPMIHYVLDALACGGVHRMIVVVGHRADLVEAAVRGRPDGASGSASSCSVEFALQAEQLGTGHAVMACRRLLEGHDGPVLVVAGDSPFMQPQSITALLKEFERQPAACILGTAHAANPQGLGRILRDVRGNFLGVVEHKDATVEQRRITEVNMSYYVFNCRDLLEALDHIRADNSQREYYITDCPGVLAAQGKPIRALCVLKPCEALSINTPEELVAVEGEMERMRDEG